MRLGRRSPLLRTRRRTKRQRGGNPLPKIAVITAIFGDYDTLKEPTDVRLKEKVDWFCFTDSTTYSSPLWKIDRRPYHLENETEEEKKYRNSISGTQYQKVKQMMSAKYYKLQTHKVESLKGYQYYIWVDGSISLRPTFLENMFKFITSGKKLINFKHLRNSVKDEMMASIHMTKYKNQPLQMQYNAYLQDGFPDTQGLFENTIICKQNNPSINRAFDEWWLQNLKWTYQDQISYTYSLWKHNVYPDQIIYESVFDNPNYSYLKREHYVKHLDNNWKGGGSRCRTQKKRGV